MSTFNWTCPYCKHKTTIVKESNYSSETHYYDSPSVDGHIAFVSEIIVCPNPDCREYVINCFLFGVRNNETDFLTEEDYGKLIRKWNLKQDSKAIPQPDYIPAFIRKDYEEACAILTLSPKASATLSRRCLQGMIRHFWGISKNRLKDEIDALEEKLDSTLWNAIDSIRKIGNIGAHMEKDVNTIVEVEPSEAALMIQLIEYLFAEWYVARHEKQARMKKLSEIAKTK